MNSYKPQLPATMTLAQFIDHARRNKLASPKNIKRYLNDQLGEGVQYNEPQPYTVADWTCDMNLFLTEPDDL